MKAHQGDDAVTDVAPFDLRMSRRGYQLNKMAFSLNHAANRERFKQDNEAYMEAFAIPPEQREMVRKRDFVAMLHAGGNINFLLKLGVAMGATLYHMGAQMRGLTYEEFMLTRNSKGAV